MLANREVRAFLFDVTSEDRSTLAAFETAIKNPHLVSTDYLADESWAHEYVKHALNVSNRIVEMDWAEGEVAIFDYFSALCDLENIKIPDTIEYYLIKKEPEIKRDEAPELVAALLQETINQAGYEILHLNGGDDQYRFLLAPLEAASKWDGAALGNCIKVEIPSWDVPLDFIEFKTKKERRKPRSKLVRHLRKQSEKAVRGKGYEFIFSEIQGTLIAALEKSNYQEEDSEEFRRALNGVSGCAIALIDDMAKSFGNNYFVKNFDYKACSLFFYYEMLAVHEGRYNDDRISIVSVPNFVMFALIGKLSQQKIWTAFATPRIRQILDSRKEDLNKITAQFPLMPLLVEEGDLVEKTHDLLSTAYKIDSRKEPALLYELMIKDRIQYTKLLPDLYMSIYSSVPFSFLPLEILYVSTLIDLPLSEDLVELRDKLRELVIETDEGIMAIEKHFGVTGK